MQFSLPYWHRCFSACIPTNKNSLKCIQHIFRITYIRISDSISMVLYKQMSVSSTYHYVNMCAYAITVCDNAAGITLLWQHSHDSPVILYVNMLVCASDVDVVRVDHD